MINEHVHNLELAFVSVIIKENLYNFRIFTACSCHQYSFLNFIIYLTLPTTDGANHRNTDVYYSLYVWSLVLA